MNKGDIDLSNELKGTNALLYIFDVTYNRQDIEEYQFKKDKILEARKLLFDRGELFYPSNIQYTRKLLLSVPLSKIVKYKNTRLFTEWLDVHNWENDSHIYIFIPDKSKSVTLNDYLEDQGTYRYPILTYYFPLYFDYFFFLFHKQLAPLSKQYNMNGINIYDRLYGMLFLNDPEYSEAIREQFIGTDNEQNIILNIEQEMEIYHNMDINKVNNSNHVMWRLYHDEKETRRLDKYVQSYDVANDIYKLIYGSYYYLNKSGPIEIDDLEYKYQVVGDLFIITITDKRTRKDMELIYNVKNGLIRMQRHLFRIHYPVFK